MPELRRTFGFLGVQDTVFAPDLQSHPNRQPEKPQLAPDARQALVEAYSPDVAKLIDDFHEIDIGLWPNFGHLN